MINKIEGKIAVLDLADYPAEAITSRTILKEKGGTVTFFAYAKGQSLSEHTTPFEAIAHILDGRAEITIAGKIYQLGAGDLLQMPANIPHAVAAVEPFKMLLVMIRAGD